MFSSEPNTPTSANNNNNSQYSKPLIERPLSFVPRLNGKVELNSKPKPFKPIVSNQENVKSVSSPIKFQHIEATNDNNSNVFRAQLVLNNNHNNNNSSFLSASSNSLKSNYSTSDELNSDSDRAWQAYRNNDLARSCSSGSLNGNKRIERNLSINDKKSVNTSDEYKNSLSPCTTNSDCDDDHQRKNWNKTEEMKFNRLQVKKTIQARLAEALGKSSPVLVNGLILKNFASNKKEKHVYFQEILLINQNFLKLSCLEACLNIEMKFILYF